MHIALDKDTNDLILPIGGGISRVSEGRFVVQNVKSRLNTFLGEWIPKPSIGFIDLTTFEKDPDLYDIEVKAIKVILDTKGVKEIINLSTEMTGRKVYLKFSALTLYGKIELTVPWGIRS